MRKIFKILLIIIGIIILLNVLGLCDLKLYADSTLIDVTEDPGAWEPSKTTNERAFELEYERFTSKMGIIAGAVQVIGTIVSVGSLSVIGIKFMLGSAEERAQYKQTLIPWLIGAIMVFAMTNIPTIIYNISKGMFSESTTQEPSGGSGGGPGLRPPGQEHMLN